MIAHVWVYHDQMEAWVKLRLTSKHTQDDPLILRSTHGQHEEGFSAVEEALWLEEDGVHHCTVEDGRDCDGRYHNHSEYRCDYANLESGGSPEEQYEPTGPDDDGWRLMGDVKKPLWVEVSIELNDYTAQAAGY